MEAEYWVKCVPGGEAMTQWMEQARALLRAGRWLELRAMEPELLAQSGEALLAAHVQLCMAYVNSAACLADWQMALRHVTDVLKVAPRDSITHVWALQATSAIYTNLRRPRETIFYAKAFLREASGREDAQHLLPYGWQHLGVAARQQNQFKRALHFYRIAEAGFRHAGNALEAHRMQLLMLWAELKAGSPARASRYLPSDPVPEHVAFWHGARALLAAAASDWQTARAEAMKSLEGPWSSIDGFVAAEVCLLLAQISRRHGARAEAISWTKAATEFAARQGRALLTHLVLLSAAEGGDFLAAVASRGSGGYHPDACYSTGVGG